MLYYCNMMRWTWWDWSLRTTTSFGVWHWWLSYMTIKNCPRYDLYNVFSGMVNPAQSINHVSAVFWHSVTVISVVTAVFQVNMEPHWLPCSICSRRKPLGTVGMYLYWLVALPVTQPTVSKTGPPRIPVLKVKNSPQQPSKFPLSKTLHFCIFKYTGFVLALYVYLRTAVVCLLWIAGNNYIAL